MSCLKSALQIVKQYGWRIFPADLSTPQKKSHKSKKYSDGVNWGATSDPVQIREDFSSWPNAGIGIPTGPENEIFVVEADTKEGHKVDGIASLAELENQHGELPHTLMAQSPTGSLHFYFNYPTDGTIIKNSVSAIAPGIDIRGRGGMVIAPPSKRPDGFYQWLNTAAIVDAPDWLLEKIKIIDQPKKTNGACAAQVADNLLALLTTNVEEGARNDTATSLFGRLLWHVDDPALAVAILRMWNECRCKPPMSDGELNGVIVSIGQSEIAVRSVPL
jgi:hypothetical protein